MLIVAVDEDGQVAADQEVVQLALGLADAFEGAKALQMGTSYVGDEAAGGLGGLHKRLDVARVGGPHLHDGNVVLLVQPEQGLGHADVVIEISLGGHHVVLGAEHGGNEFLGGRLAVGASDADNGNVELAAVLTGQVLEGLEGVRHFY